MAPPSGALNMLPIPAAVPQITNILLSLSLSFRNEANVEPKPAPIWAMGPSLPALPPEPIVIIDDIDLTSGTLFLIKPLLLLYASITASVPCPSASGANV
ncbi:Uncharacterised protein [uncultured archaeon]|nr:Uncharacterised protein [uncultured archaeon]